MEDDTIEKFKKIKDAEIMEKCNNEKIKIMMKYLLLGLIVVVSSILVWHNKINSNEFIIGFIVGIVMANMPKNR